MKQTKEAENGETTNIANILNQINIIDMYLTSRIKLQLTLFLLKFMPILTKQKTKSLWARQFFIHYRFALGTLQTEITILLLNI
ncbi:CLUMA_CG014766, isoform A [Clunio marinus]|uniref:CLUMA_CG014766, isoform A n=1 Tax=Clunio marinus TaxID=568069 RepID=A0A1J1IMN9_9DIPT|nr:CLUMA_CG014766, isoform A [Clunio marinus]